jgi:hypothetical protein
MPFACAAYALDDGAKSSPDVDLNSTEPGTTPPLLNWPRKPTFLHHIHLDPVALAHAR